MAESVRTGAPVWESASIAAAERYADLAERGLEFPGIVILPLLAGGAALGALSLRDRKSTRLNSSHSQISYAVFCLKKKKTNNTTSAAYCTPSTQSPTTSRSYALTTIIYPP